MAHITTSVEYAIHCLLWLVGHDNRPVSSRDLAELQGVSPTFLAKIFPRLEKAGIVRASDGVRGGYLLARAANEISFLDVVDAVEGEKPLFECQEVRGRCAIFGGQAPGWATAGTCAIHAVMVQAEKAMRDTLASQTLADVGERFVRKAPSQFLDDANDWINDRVDRRAKRAGGPARGVPH